MAARDQMQAERFDEGRLTHAGRAADTDADRSQRVRQQRLQHGLPASLVIAPGRLDERDRLRERTPLAGAHAGHERLVGRRQRRSRMFRNHAGDTTAVALPQRWGG
jgi:hypothetical protein